MSCSNRLTDDGDDNGDDSDSEDEGDDCSVDCHEQEEKMTLDGSLSEQSSGSTKSDHRGVMAEEKQVVLEDENNFTKNTGSAGKEHENMGERQGERGNDVNDKKNQLAPSTKSPTNEQHGDPVDHEEFHDGQPFPGLTPPND